MPYRNKQMLRDANGDLIPQYWDVAAGDFKPLTGSDGANDTRVTGSNVVLAKVSDRLVTAGTYLSLTDTVSLDDIRKLYILVRAEESHSFQAEIAFFATAATFGSQVFPNALVHRVENGTRPEKPSTVEVAGELANAGVRNLDTIDHRYDLTLMGVR